MVENNGLTNLPTKEQTVLSDNAYEWYDLPLLTPVPIKRSWTYTLAQGVPCAPILTLDNHRDFVDTRELLFFLVRHELLPVHIAHVGLGLPVVHVHIPAGHCHCKPRGVWGHHDQGGQDGKKNLQIHSPKELSCSHPQLEYWSSISSFASFAFSH